MMKFRLTWLGLLVMLLSTVAAAPGGTPRAVPLGLQWSLPELVPGYDGEASAPYLIADHNRAVHAFNSVMYENELLITYSQWTVTGGWTSPTDILLSPEKRQARILGAFGDESDWAHVAFFGGDDFSAGIYYSKAPLAQAGRASAWANVRLVGDQAGTPTAGAITGDGKGRLTIVYSGKRDGVGLYSVTSLDSGETWSEPSIVYLVPDEVHWPTAVRLALDAEGRLHAVWTLVNSGGTGDNLYYASLDPEMKEWSDAEVLATKNPGDYEVDWGSIIAYDDQIFVIYDDSFPATRWMRRSADGGQTWSNPVLLFNYVGEYGHAALVVDGDNYLHMILGNRTQDQTHGMWHSVWLGDRWSDLEPVVSGPRVTSGPLEARFDPSAPQAVVSMGNVLLATWSTDPGAGRNGVWSSFAVLNTKEQPARPLANPQPTTTPTPRRMETSIKATAQTLAVADTGGGLNFGPGGNIPSPSVALSAAVFPALLLVLGVVVYRLYVTSRK